MKKNSISFYVLIISIMTFITLFAIVVTNSYNNLMTPVNSAQSNSLGKPIDLDLKLNVIDVIESRK